MRRRTYAHRTCGPSDLWAVGLVGRRTYKRRTCGLSDLWVVGLVAWTRKDRGRTLYFFVIYGIKWYTNTNICFFRKILHVDRKKTTDERSI